MAVTFSDLRPCGMSTTIKCAIASRLSCENIKATFTSLKFSDVVELSLFMQVLILTFSPISMPKRTEVTRRFLFYYPFVVAGNGRTQRKAHDPAFRCKILLVLLLFARERLCLSVTIGNVPVPEWVSLNCDAMDMCKRNAPQTPAGASRVLSDVSYHRAVLGAN